jgi:hypothetical protein
MRCDILVLADGKGGHPAWLHLYGALSGAWPGVSGASIGSGGGALIWTLA